MATAYQEQKLPHYILNKYSTEWEKSFKDDKIMQNAKNMMLTHSKLILKPKNMEQSKILNAVVWYSD